MTVIDSERYSRAMSSGLDVVLRGSDLPADRVLTQLQNLVHLLGLAEDGALHRDRKPTDRTSWSFGELGLGSVHALLTPLAPAHDVGEEQLRRAPLSIVDGFEHAEASDDLPVGWSEEFATFGRRVTQDLGDAPTTGMTLTLIQDGKPVRSATVTRRAATHLKAAVDMKRTSVGSIVGTLASVNTRRSQAGLWTDLDDRRVTLSIAPGQLDVVAENLGGRVLVAGTLTRNAVGQVLSVRPDDIAPWPRGRRRLTDSGGVARGHLGGEDPVDHLERVGGWAP